MDPALPVFDISSDEEPVEEPSGRDDDHNWLTEILETVNKFSDDSDDVIIVGEYKPPKPKSRKRPLHVVDLEDDDCVVLEADPDNPLALSTGHDKDDAGDDGVVFVAQKGQIACRDYPHPRHDCAKFPFSSDPHAKYCELCHCYVCDSPAPCGLWGTGLSSADHCHANDKQEDWRSLRQAFRQLKDAGKSVSCVAGNSCRNEVVCQSNQAVSVGGGMPLPKLGLQNQVHRQTTIRACTSSTTFDFHNIISRGRIPVAGYIPGRNRLLPQSVSKQAHGFHNNTVRQFKFPDKRVVSSNTAHKRPRFVGGSMSVNQSAHSSVCNSKSAPVWQQDGSTASLSTNPTLCRDSAPNLILPPFTDRISAQSNMCSNIGNESPSKPETSFPLPSVCQNVCQPRNQNQDAAATDFNGLGYGWVSSSSQNSHIRGDSWVDSSSQNNHHIQSESNLLASLESVSGAPAVEQAGSLILRGARFQDQEFENRFSNLLVPVGSEESALTVETVRSPDLHYTDIDSLSFDVYGVDPRWNGVT